MADPNAPASVSQQLWAVDGFEGFFSTKTGGEVTAESTSVTDGGERKPTQLGGAVRTTSNIVLTKPYRSGKHQAKLKQLDAVTGSYRTTVSGYDTDPDLGPWGEPTVYADALLVRVKRPDHDIASAEGGYFELEFAVSEGV